MTQATLSKQHTPTPWMLDPHFVLRDADGEWVTRLNTSRRHDNKHDPEAEANAEFIVRCVNAHDELVAALRDIIASVEKCGIGIVDLSRGRAALAKVQA
jgi:hypothetical protein